MKKVVLLFPGQGSQTPGMGQELAAVYPAARAVFAAVNDTLGFALSEVCFSGPAEVLTETRNAQPALLTHGAALWLVLRDAIGDSVVAAAGHSLGEFTAYHSGDAISLPDAALLVRRRGELMFAAGEKRPGAMAAILGEMTISIEEVCAAASGSGVVVPANFNAPGQVVISGEAAGVDHAMALAKEMGAKRAMALKVSGAFHSPLMAEAAAGLQEALELTPFADPRFPIYANVDAQPVHDAALAKRKLVEQLTAPVQWIREVEAITSLYPDALYVEMGPGSVLKGLVKKIAPNVTVVTCGTPADIDSLLALVAT